MLGYVFTAMLVLLCLAVPISVVLAIISFIPGVLDPNFVADAIFILRQAVSGLNNPALLAIPMFVFSGVIMARGGLSEKLFNVFAYFIGDRTGGMPCAVVVTCLFYGAISGSAPATTAAVGSMTIPILVSMGYDLTFCAALVATAGGLGIIIPPSIPFILYCSGTGASVGALFIAGVLPGILIGIMLMIYAVYYCKKHGEDKERIRENVSKLRAHGFWNVFKDGFWAILTPIFILGGIYSGITTPTEAAVVSVIYALIVSLFIYRTVKLSELWALVVESINTYAPLLFILGSASAFGKVLTLTQVPQLVATSIGTIFDSKVSLLIAINVFLLFVGMIMDAGPAILILSPILAPIVSSYGMHPIQFGVIMIANLAIGHVTPPVGNNLYVASTLTRVPVMTIAKKTVPFMLFFLAALMIITFVPQVSMLLTGIN
jgi:C4-dicarboxylate transporter DctM subunit